jgi:dipeptidyl-peptidase-4
VSTLLDTKNHPELKSIDNYTFDSKEQKILLATNSNPIFRHSLLPIILYMILLLKKSQNLQRKQFKNPVFLPMVPKLPMLLRTIYLWLI